MGKNEKAKNVVVGKKSTVSILSTCYQQSQDSGVSTEKWLKFCKSVRGLSREALIKKCVESGFTV